MFGYLLLLIATNCSPFVVQDSLVEQINSASQNSEYEKLDSLWTKYIANNPKYNLGYYHRGRARFCAGKIEKSVADFDKYVELRPSQSSRQWERGIALYYAKKYREGAEQFEEYQTYHDNDVENSAWRYLCVAKSEGVARAEKNLLPIENDTRVPMMKIYSLYQGKCKPQDVLELANQGKGTLSKTAHNRQLFYAHLYVGLYYEVRGKEELAKKHISLAQDHKINHYMWDVANIHAKMLERAKEKSAGADQKADKQNDKPSK